MKIFGKVKSNVGASTTVVAEGKKDSKVENESDVPSYFASAASPSPRKRSQRRMTDRTEIIYRRYLKWTLIS